MITYLMTVAIKWLIDHTREYQILPTLLFSICFLILIHIIAQSN